MKIEDIRAKTDAELEFELVGLKKTLFETRFRASTGTDAKTSKIGEMRKNVARITTILHERTIGVRGAASK